MKPALHCIRVLVALVLALSSAALPASASNRVALVIGNAAYSHAPRLANPLNDAADVGDALERLGFAVTRLRNTERSALWDGLQKFALAASASEIAVVFYAGHGIEVDGRNFLVPTDARLQSDREVEFETVPLELVSRAVERARGLSLVILDACRENPFAAAMQRAGATRSVGRGLARVEPLGETLVAYAAKEGTLAADGQGRNSPYSAALLKHLEEPGLEVGLMFRRVRDGVLAATGGAQEPFVYGSLSSQGVYLKEPAQVAGAEADAAPGVAPGAGQRLTAEHLAAERLFWESVEDTEDPEEIHAYLERYPEGTFASLALTRLGRMSKPAEEAVAATTESDPMEIEESLGLSRADRRLVQHGLASLGHAPGPIDGVFGPRTRRAIRAHRAEKGLPEGEHLTEGISGELLELGRNEARRIEAERPKLPSGDEWMVFQNQKCAVHGHDLNFFALQGIRPIRTLTWSGGCKNGMASGVGVLQVKFALDGVVNTYRGTMNEGRITGQGTRTETIPLNPRYESTWEGKWINGRAHGTMSVRYPEFGAYTAEFNRGDLKHDQTFTFVDRNGRRHSVRRGAPRDLFDDASYPQCVPIIKNVWISSWGLIKDASPWTC